MDSFKNSFDDPANVKNGPLCNHRAIATEFVGTVILLNGSEDDGW